MKRARLLRVALPVALLWGCSGGGGTTAALGGAPWAKFRHDVSNTGQGAAIFPLLIAATVTPHVTWSQEVDAPPATPTPGAPQSETPAGGAPVSASAAVALDGTIYVGSEGGTLLAANPNGSVKWRVTNCNACANAPVLGPLVSSPTVYTLTTEAIIEQTNVLVASTNGTLYLFTDLIGTAPIPPVCTACFRPQDIDPTVMTASFVSSPAFTTNATTFNLSGIFIGAEITTSAQPKTTTGVLYAVNSDGSLRWQFPVAGPINSSPALGASNTIYVIAGDGNLYVFTFDGRFLWSFPVGAGLDPSPSIDEPAFISSPVTSTLVYTGTVNGEILAVNPDGSSTHWRVAPQDLNLSPADAAFVGSLALGNPADTPTPMISPTPTTTPTLAPSAPSTPTPTPTLSIASVFGVTKSGIVVMVDNTTGGATPFPTPKLTSSQVVAPVLASPALSADGFLIFGDSAGRLHAINTGTATGEEPPGWPLTLNPTPAAIRSSPAIGADGTIYVSDDHGILYAVRAQ